MKPCLLITPKNKYDFEFTFVDTRGRKQSKAPKNFSITQEDVYLKQGAVFVNIKGHLYTHE